MFRISGHWCIRTKWPKSRRDRGPRCNFCIFANWFPIFLAAGELNVAKFCSSVFRTPTLSLSTLWDPCTFPNFESRAERVERNLFTVRRRRTAERMCHSATGDSPKRVERHRTRVHVILRRITGESLASLQCASV